MPGVAFRQPTDRKPSATHHAVFRQRLDGVIRTSRVEPAARPEQRAQRPLIDTDQDHADLLHFEMSGNRSCNEARHFFATGGWIARRATQLNHHVAACAAALATTAERLPDHTLQGVACDGRLDQAFCDDEAQPVVRKAVRRCTYDEPLPAVPFAPHRRAKLRGRMQPPMRRKPVWRRQRFRVQEFRLSRAARLPAACDPLRDGHSRLSVHPASSSGRGSRACVRGEPWRVDKCASFSDPLTLNPSIKPAITALGTSSCQLSQPTGALSPVDKCVSGC